MWMAISGSIGRPLDVKGRRSTVLRCVRIRGPCPCSSMANRSFAFDGGDTSSLSMHMQPVAGRDGRKGRGRRESPSLSHSVSVSPHLLRLISGAFASASLRTGMHACIAWAWTIDVVHVQYKCSFVLGTGCVPLCYAPSEYTCKIIIVPAFPTPTLPSILNPCMHALPRHAIVSSVRVLCCCLLHVCVCCIYVPRLAIVTERSS